MRCVGLRVVSRSDYGVVAVAAVADVTVPGVAVPGARERRGADDGRAVVVVRLAGFSLALDEKRVTS